MHCEPRHWYSLLLQTQLRVRYQPYHQIAWTHTEEGTNNSMLRSIQIPGTMRNGASSLWLRFSPNTCSFSRTPPSVKLLTSWIWPMSTARRYPRLSTLWKSLTKGTLSLTRHGNSRECSPNSDDASITIMRLYSIDARSSTALSLWLLLDVVTLSQFDVWAIRYCALLNSRRLPRPRCTSVFRSIAPVSIFFRISSAFLRKAYDLLNWYIINLVSCLCRNFQEEEVVILSELCTILVWDPPSMVNCTNYYASISHLLPTRTNVISGFPFSLASSNHLDTFLKESRLVMSYTKMAPAADR